MSATRLQRRRRIERVSPASFLRVALAMDMSRGFWASGERWVAHAGVMEDLSLEGEEGQGAAKRRFATVEERAREVFRRYTNRYADEHSGPARFFGGFAFAGHATADAAWSPFGTARFHLPEVEIEYRPEIGACWLTVRGADPGVVDEHSRAWVEAMAAEQASGVDQRLHVAPAGFRRAGQITGMGRTAWEAMVANALGQIKTGDADKVVLARTLDVKPDGRIEPEELVTALWRENRGSHVFLYEPEPGHAMVGAAPETLATVANGVLRATAVAGSVGVGANSVETAHLADQLFHSAKDRAEHDFVVRDMVARLEALGCSVGRDVEPHVLALARIQHLETKIVAKLPAELSLLAVVGSLHPTPAVCGIPREVALAVLTENEVFDRGWYAGPVGWLDSDGRGIFVPALRSAVLCNGSWRLFAGAGIVAGSDPVSEWEETEIKFQPVLRAMVRAEVSARARVGVGAGAGAGARAKAGPRAE